MKTIKSQHMFKLKNVNNLDDEITDFFIKQLLEMKHVSTVTKFDNLFHQLLLFLDKNGFMYNSDVNEHYMMNCSQYKKIMPENILYCCDVYNGDTFLSRYKNNCNKRWYLYLKNKFNPMPFVQDDKSTGYFSSHKCPELFAQIVFKLEKMDYLENQYIAMTEELEELKPKMVTIEKDKADVRKLLNTLITEINKTSAIKPDTDRDLHKELNEAGEKLKLLDCYQVRYDELRSLLVEDNIRKVKNIKIFINAVRNTNEFKEIEKQKIDEQSRFNTLISPSAPPHENVITYAYVSGDNIKMI